MRRHGSALLLCFFLLLVGSSAHAQEIDPAADLEARGLYSAGEGAYAAGRFEPAYEYFQRAYELSHRPELLYNLGLAAASAGHERESIAAFERYLAELPDATNRGIAEGRIASMRAELAEEDAVEARLAAVEATDAEAAARARERAAQATAVQRDAGWGLVVTGSVLLAAGVIFSAIGFSDIASVEGAAEGTPWPSLNDANARAPIFTGIGLAAGATGIAALGIGLGLALSAGPGLEAASPAPTARLVPVIDPVSGLVGLSAIGSF